MHAIVAVTPDLLTLWVPLREGYAYPTVNKQIGQVKGKKTPAYHALAEDVESAGRAARQQGWEPIAFPCVASITLYTPDNYVRDALNIGGCEANALTRSTVWTDDTLANPATKRIVFGAEPPRRVLITVQRLAPPAGTAPRAARGAVKITRITTDGIASESRVTAWIPGDPIPDGYALENGKLIPFADALRKIGVEKVKHG